MTLRQIILLYKKIYNQKFTIYCKRKLTIYLLVQQIKNRKWEWNYYLMSHIKIFSAANENYCMYEELLYIN